MFRMLQWLYTHIANFCSQCFICFLRRMLQVYLFGCCICFTYMLQVFYLLVAYILQWFWDIFASVSDACFKCFICFRTYVTSVESRYFKSRSGVASPSSPSAVLPRYLLLLSPLAGHSNQRHRQAPPPPPVRFVAVRNLTWGESVGTGVRTWVSSRASGRARALP
jgi:hypothetical protein